VAGYDFLRGLRVLEVAWLGPASLGGYLADLGAEVVKIEGHEGDPLRNLGSAAAVEPDGPGLLHLRWNRGKESVGLDLKHEVGRRLFCELADRSQVVIEGARAGMLERLGLGYETLVRTNPRLVFCSLSGFGRSGPYHTLPSHAPAFDAFGGIAALNPYAFSLAERRELPYAPVGMHALGLYAAVAVLAAVRRAENSGKGAIIEVTGAEAAAHWLPEGLNAALNPECLVERQPPFTAADGRMLRWARMYPYETADGRAVFLQAQNPKFWSLFCAAIGRSDLDPQAEDQDSYWSDTSLHIELKTVFKERAFKDWMRLFLDHGIPGTPVNSLSELTIDPHFMARENIYDSEYRGQKLRLTSTPIKTPEQPFQPSPAPDLWADTETVLGRVLGMPADEIRQLADSQAILTRPAGTQ
jgi:crotonobetainyl-CoA:carnitine CoA-transferase CaiB-like acyl-CoA transferase